MIVSIWLYLTSLLSLFNFLFVPLQSNYKDLNVLLSLNNMARLISRQEAARLLDVSLQTVSNWIEKGYIKGHMIDKHLMVDRETIEHYFDGLKELAHLEKTVEEKKECLRKEDFKLGLEINDLLEAREKMERLRKSVEVTPTLFFNKVLYVTITIGVVQNNEIYKEPEDVIKVADERMYYGKQHGKNIVVYEDN